MFRAKTVIVIGAGASFEVGMPVGEGLLKQIVELTDIRFSHFDKVESGDPDIVEALQILLNEGTRVKKLNEHLAAACQLRKSAKQALSIDNVIDALEGPKVELVGKLGIVRAILASESASPIFRTTVQHAPELDLSKFNQTWYSSFTKLLTENVRKSELKNIFENIEIVNFNYDRCLEHYLPFSLSNYYGTTHAAVQEAMQALVVHRPYGVAGRLPWQAKEGPSVVFGQRGPRLLAEVSQQIRTFTERVEEGSQLMAMKTAISMADRIVFLGFAFHRQNVELLSQKVQPHTEVVGTAYGISKSDKSVIEQELERAFEFGGILNDNRIVLADTKCDQFFKDYWRTLTAEKGDHEEIAFPG